MRPLASIFNVATLINYEWDEAKRAVNFAKHGLDFSLAPQVHEAEFKATRTSPRGDEERWADIATVDGEGLTLCLIYARRDKTVCVISLRRANRKEKRIYAKAKDQALHQ